MKQLILMLSVLLAITGPVLAQVTDQQKAIVIRSALLDEENRPIDLAVDGQHNFFWPDKTKYTMGLKKAFNQGLLVSKNTKVELVEGVTNEQLLAIPEFQQLADDTIEPNQVAPTDGFNWTWPIIVAGLALVSLAGIGLAIKKRQARVAEEDDDRGAIKAEFEMIDATKPDTDQLKLLVETIKGYAKQAETAKQSAEKNAERAASSALRATTNQGEVKRRAELAEAAAHDAHSALKEARELAEKCRFNAEQCLGLSAEAELSLKAVTKQAQEMSLVSSKITDQQAAIKTTIKEAMDDIKSQKEGIKEIIEEAKAILDQAVEKSAQKSGLPTIKPSGPDELVGEKVIKPVKHLPNEELKAQYEAEKAKRKKEDDQKDS